MEEGGREEGGKREGGGMEGEGGRERGGAGGGEGGGRWLANRTRSAGYRRLLRATAVVHVHKAPFHSFHRLYLVLVFVRIWVCRN
jgi:hypothetical protein